MAQTVLVGMAVSSDNNSSLATSTIENVSLSSGTQPLVQTLSPSSGPVGTSVTINGVSFGATQGTSTVTFDGTPASSITSWSDTQIVATVPTTVQTGPVVVTVNSVASNSNVIFTAFNPVIENVTPSAGQVYGQVTLNGYGFGPSQGSGGSVQFNGVNANSIVSWSDTSIVAYVPLNATSGPLTVTMNGVTSNQAQFTVVIRQNPIRVENTSILSCCGGHEEPAIDLVLFSGPGVSLLSRSVGAPVAYIY
jgi:IPT/TIG domain